MIGIDFVLNANPLNNNPISRKGGYRYGMSSNIILYSISYLYTLDEKYLTLARYFLSLSLKKISEKKFEGRICEEFSDFMRVLIFLRGNNLLLDKDFCE